MMTSDEIRLKVEALERSAAQADGALAAQYRQIALQWRRLELETMYMDALKACLDAEA